VRDLSLTCFCEARPGADVVIFEVFSPKVLAKLHIGVVLLELLLVFAKILALHWFF
jgi:hypothetical protein